MKQYLALLQHILDKGTSREDRTGTGTISVFGHQMRFDLNEGFPLITTKKVHFKSVVHELLWFIKGETNIRNLVLNDCRIWNEWPFQKYQKSSDYRNESMKEFIEKIKTDEDFAKIWGNLGPVYGKQWRKFEGNGKSIDQLKWVLEEIQHNPHSRRLIVNSWHAAEIEDMALPPCHMMFQFYVQDNRLSCQLYQRSADVFLGVPFNIASYSLLTMMIAHVLELDLGEFIHTIGDGHIYNDHIDLVKLQISRTPKPLPKLILNQHIKDLFAFKESDIILENYDSHSAIKGKVSV